MLAEVCKWCAAALIISITTFSIIWLFSILYYTNKEKSSQLNG